MKWCYYVYDAADVEVKDDDIHQLKFVSDSDSSVCLFSFLLVIKPQTLILIQQEPQSRETPTGSCWETHWTPALMTGSTTPDFYFEILSRAASNVPNTNISRISNLCSDSSADSSFTPSQSNCQVLQVCVTSLSSRLQSPGRRARRGCNSCCRPAGGEADRQTGRERETDR